MADKTVQLERQAFAERLAKAFKDAGVRNSATTITMEYNLQAGTSVSVHAVRKWLLGESIPRQEHLAGLSNWLHCDTAWLRYGAGSPPVTKKGARSVHDTVLLRDLSRLDAKSKRLVRVLVDELTKMQ